jgi:hypothetical protein
MPAPPEEPEQYFSPKEMRQWAEQEIKDVNKAAELRIREVNEIVRAYSGGEITPEKAGELQFKYDHRWGEALRGTNAVEGRTDEQILAAIDSTRRPFVSPRDSREQYRKQFGRNPDDDVPGR